MILKHYEIVSEKLKGGADFSALLLSDVHGADPGELKDLIIGIKEISFILFPGDSLTATREQDWEKIKELFRLLREKAPVYFVNGNHESYLREYCTFGFDPYEDLMSVLRDLGVTVLNDRRLNLRVKQHALCLAGLELPMEAYRKFTRPRIRTSFIKRRLGMPDPERFTLLLAHNPHFADAYFDWGADLIVSGHYHGGLIRLPGSGRALMDPYGFPLPKYGYGRYEKDGRQMIVTGGAGDHVIPIRIRNPREAVLLSFRGKTDIKDEER